jgi:hypothetical protein
MAASTAPGLELLTSGFEMVVRDDGLDAKLREQRLRASSAPPPGGPTLTFDRPAVASR